MATKAYRSLLRAAKELCGADRTSLQKSQAEIRSHFDKSRGVKDASAIQKLLNDAYEAEDFIKRHLVQAKRTNRGTYAVKLKDPDAIDANTKREHVDFEPLPPQVALEKSTTPVKAPQVHTTNNKGCCGGH